MKQTVVFDFDGVIHSYTSGWQATEIIADPPVPGIKEAIEEIRAAGYEVVVVSTRCATMSGYGAIRAWLDDHGIEVDGLRTEKPPAIVYIDDRAICFDGDPSKLLRKIQRFEPWNRKDTVAMTSIDQILDGDKEALVQELADVIRWARRLSNTDWYNICNNFKDGLEGFVRKVVGENSH